ncbi:MAG: energy transducer TonB [Deltaproteobacteria bacterium]|nr:energy transducer TonB [Deltaproteobacteria bacterium]
MDSLHDCLERLQSKHKDLSGKLTISFHISENGKVDQARIKSSDLRDKRTEKCFLHHFRKLRFRPGGSTHVTQPMRVRVPRLR